jgi:hypothetical protein
MPWGIQFAMDMWTVSAAFREVWGRTQVNMVVQVTIINTSTWSNIRPSLTVTPHRYIRSSDDGEIWEKYNRLWRAWYLGDYWGMRVGEAPTGGVNREETAFRNVRLTWTWKYACNFNQVTKIQLGSSLPHRLLALSERLSNLDDFPDEIRCVLSVSSCCILPSLTDNLGLTTGSGQGTWSLEAEGWRQTPPQAPWVLASGPALCLVPHSPSFESRLCVTSATSLLARSWPKSLADLLPLGSQTRFTWTHIWHKIG